MCDIKKIIISLFFTVPLSGALDSVAKILPIRDLQRIVASYLDDYLYDQDIDAAPDFIHEVAVSNRGKYLAVSFYDKVQIWRLDNGIYKLMQNIDVDNSGDLLSRTGFWPLIPHLAFSQNGDFLGITSEYNVFIWQLDGNKFILKQKLPHKRARSVVFSPDGKSVAASSRNNTISIWQLTKPWGLYRCLYKTDYYALAQKITTQSDLLGPIFFARGDTYLIAATKNKTIDIWELRNGLYVKAQELSSKNGDISQYAVSRNGTYIAAALNDNSLVLWKFKDNKYVPVEGMKLDNVPNAMALSPDGTFLALAMGKDIMLFREKNGEFELQELDSSDTIEQKINDLTFSPDNIFLVAGLHTRNLIVWQNLEYAFNNVKHEKSKQKKAEQTITEVD